MLYNLWAAELNQLAATMPNTQYADISSPKESKGIRSATHGAPHSPFIPVSATYWYVIDYRPVWEYFLSGGINNASA
jgi:hypothetical protein